MTNVLSVDVEEYFHPSEVPASTNPDLWPSFPSRIDDQILRTLDLLEQYETKATFFMLGWVAERRPHVVRSIVAGGHEVGCHSYSHRLVYQLSPAEFRRDTERAVAAIEDAGGITPRLYRAPSYSITGKSLWALDILVECGFTHDSSIYPIHHDRYGIPGSNRHAHPIETASGPILEIPIGTVHLSKNRVAPIGGGAYLRLLPYRYIAAGIRRVNHNERQPVCIYFHPWEIDPDQPQLTTGAFSRIRTYSGTKGMHAKLARLLADFRFSTLTDVHGGAIRTTLVAAR